MNLRRLLSQAALVIGALVFSIGLQAFAAGWAAPTAGPTGGNAVAPLDTGANLNQKTGSLVVNNGGGAATGLIVAGGNVGIGSTFLLSAPAHTLDVNGDVHATGDICTDAGGGKCLSTVGGGGGGVTSIIAGSGISVNPATGTGNVTLDVKNSPMVYQCPVYRASGTASFSGTPVVCPSACSGQLVAGSSVSCTYATPGAYNCEGPQGSLSCSTFIGYLVQQ